MENDISEQVLDWVRSRYFGKYRGTVTDNQDETKRGRLKVKVPAVLGDEQEVWAMPCAPYAGAGVGIYALPEAGAGVWVEFEGGDPSFAIWTGFFWADDELPKNERSTQAKPDLKIMRSQQGLLLALSDGDQTISLSDKDGSNLVKIQVQQGQVTVRAGVKVVVEAPQIELVQNASHPLAFGDQLLTYINSILIPALQTHVHPGELALGVFPVTIASPVVPFPPATPDLLSMRVKTG